MLNPKKKKKKKKILGTNEIQCIYAFFVKDQAEEYPIPYKSDVKKLLNSFRKNI